MRLDNGACGATTNPVIVGNVLKKELSLWEPTIEELILRHPEATEDDLAWMMIKAMGQKASLLLKPNLKEHGDNAAGFRSRRMQNIIPMRN